MVVYYSWTGNTKAYAEALAAKKGLPVFELKEKRTRERGKLDFVLAIFQAAFRKETEVVAISDISGCSDIFVCTPVWVGSFTPAIRYWLNRVDLTNKKVNFLFTCAEKNTNSQGFQKIAADFIKDKDGIAGEVYTFSTEYKKPPDYEKAKEDIAAL